MEGFESKEEQLATVNEAIHKIMVGGQSYKIGTKQLTRADLNTLLKMQAQLRAEIAISARSCACIFSSVFKSALVSCLVPIL